MAIQGKWVPPPAPLADETLDPEKREQYLEAIAGGTGPNIAAREFLGITGTKAKHLRNRDPEFRRQYEQAREQGHAEYQDLLQGTAREQATGAEPNVRILEVELATHVPEYAHLRRDRVKHEGRVEHGIIGLPPGALDALPVEKLLALREILEELGSGFVDAEEADVLELPPGDDQGGQ